jgi:hypothetical protein
MSKENTITVRWVRDATYCELKVDCPDKLHAEIVRSARKQIAKDKAALFEYGFRKALELGIAREGKQLK